MVLSKPFCPFFFSDDGAFYSANSMLAVNVSAALQGVEAASVTVEVNTGERGDLKYVLVGLPDAAVKESVDRITSAISNAGFALPATRTTINLAPGDLRKEGPSYDLPIALAMLGASGQMKTDRFNDYLIGGELGLSGKTRAIKGGLAMALLAKRKGKRGLLLPRKSADEACLVEEVECIPVDSLDEAVRFLQGERAIEPLSCSSSPFLKPPQPEIEVDFAEVKGQLNLRRALEVAMAGGHNALIIGPPGSGKSMVSKRLPSILPKPNSDEFLEILGIHSAAGQSFVKECRAYRRPFRSPHHTISDVGLLGGGAIPGPGEISLAHNGVLFLDELPEFKRSALEVLRQPLEDGEVTISRSAAKVTLPSSFMLVAAMNPCPCGYLGDSSRQCRCSVPQIQRYRARVSGPLLDRIDIHVEAPALRMKELRSSTPGESSADMAARIEPCRKKQVARFRNIPGIASNARMSQALIRKHCPLSVETGNLLQQAMEELELSARAYDRILKVSRTIADLDHSDAIQTKHLMEAIQYRTLDRNLFQ
tara:strand:- start:557 stop:2167 length:1611 start_codon:yes stop_codon:yes gene_type:complete